LKGTIAKLIGPPHRPEVGDGGDPNAAVHAECEQVGVPGDKNIGGSGDCGSKNLIVIRVPADAWNRKRHNHLRDRLELGSRRRSPIARPATSLHEHGIELTEDRGANDQRVITTEDVVEEMSRASAKVERRHQRIGVENDPHSACWLAARAAAARFHAGYDGVFSQGAGSRSFFSMGKKLIPSSAPLRVLAKRLPQEFAAGSALLVRQAVDFDRELWRKRDRHGPGRAHDPG
jgi:hypothetical protein